MNPDEARDRQQEVIATEAPLYVHACPGAGKTRVLVERFLARAGEEGRKGLAVVSFTNRASEEVAQRATGSSRRALRFPHFVGTFDRFIATFVARPHMTGPLQIVESWQRLGATVKARGVKGSFSLDDFRFGSDGTATYHARPAAIPVKATEQETLERNAALRVSELHQSGFYSCADIRTEARVLLGDDRIASRIANRFFELMVDEAQDCGAEELEILTRLQEKGLAIFMVCDPHQAIYEWRDASPELLEKFVAPLPKLQLSSNWRSSPSICALAASIRGTDTVDSSVGNESGNGTPVYLLRYEGRLSRKIGDRFLALVQEVDQVPGQSIVLAHGSRHAAQVLGEASKDVTSNLGRLAKASRSAMNHALSRRQRSYAVDELERLVGHFLKMSLEGRSVDRASDEDGIERQEWRASAIHTGARLDALGWDVAIADWVEGARRVLVEETSGFGRKTTSPNVFLKVPAAEGTKPASSLIGLSQTEGGLRYATIHDAKGTEASAVLVVLPPDRQPHNRTSRLLSDWRDKNNVETKRVLYVGVTRAQALCVVAIAASLENQAIELLTRDQVPFEVVSV